MQRMLIAAAGALVLPVAAQETVPSDTTATGGALEIASTGPRIIGTIPDGTPPPPAPPKPELEIAPEDIISTHSVQEGGRTITFRRLKPMPLPPPPEPVAAPELTPEQQTALAERFAAYRAMHPEANLITGGATVYRFPDGPPRTWVTCRSQNGRQSISFWSSADFALMSGIRGFVDSTGRTNHLMMIWSAVDTGRLAQAFAMRGKRYEPPQPPPLPEGKASFVVTGDPPDPVLAASIQDLHDLYNKEYERLKTAYEGREQARLQREAELKANPPQPKDITLNYWRSERPAPAKGGTK